MCHQSPTSLHRSPPPLHPSDKRMPCNPSHSGMGGTHLCHLNPLAETSRGGSSCHDLQCSGACQTYFPWPQTRCVDPGSILAEQCTMPDEATKVGMWNTDAHICVPSLLVHKHVYIYPTSTGNFPSLEIN